MNDNNEGDIMNVPDFLPVLSAGSHDSPSEGACVMEYVSLLAGEEWSDTPACTYRPLARAAQFVNDRLPDSERHRLVPLIGRLFGTTLPVNDSVFALRVARTVEHLQASAKACNDVTERYLAGEATLNELNDSTTHANAATYAANAAANAATYAANAAYSAANAAYSATYAANAAANAATYAANGIAGMDAVEWLSIAIDIYDELSGRTEHRDVTEADLRMLAEAVQR